MQITGALELIEKVNSKGNTYFSTRVEGQYVGNAYESVVKDFKSGDRATVTYETKGNFKNVTKIELPDNTQTATAVVEVVDSESVRVVPHPKGYDPHPTVVNEKALYLAQLFVNSQEEGKKLTKKSLMTRLAVAFELAKPIKTWLLEGVIPDGIEQLTDEE